MYFTADHGHRGHLKDRTAVPVRCSARFVHYTSVVISMHLHLLSDETLDSALIMVWGILVFFCGYAVYCLWRSGCCSRLLGWRFSGKL